MRGQKADLENAANRISPSCGGLSSELDSRALGPTMEDFQGWHQTVRMLYGARRLVSDIRIEYQNTRYIYLVFYASGGPQQLKCH